MDLPRSSSTDDFYALLKCDESSSVEQIAMEFKLMARKHHPDKVTDPEEKEAAEKHFVALQKARDVLLDTDMRRKYDQWRGGFRMWISFDDWLKMQSRVHTSIHWATSTEKMASLEQRRETSDSGRVSCGVSGGRDEEGEVRRGVVGGGGGEKGEVRHGVVGGGGGEEGGQTGGREVSSCLQQFRRNGGGGWRGSKFRNYQL